jgi:capsule polysaccharide modification protein KpsS
MVHKIKLINPDEIFERISSGKTYDEELNNYSKAVIESCIRQFIESEEYEKCVILNKYLKNLKYS